MKRGPIEPVMIGGGGRSYARRNDSFGQWAEGASPYLPSSYEQDLLREAFNAGWKARKEADYGRLSGRSHAAIPTDGLD